MDSKPQHTPGPWRTVTLVKLTQIRKPVAITVCDEYSNQIAKIAHEPKHGTSDCAEANARLIAAAPTMYEALKALVESLDWEAKRSGTTYAGHEDARAALRLGDGR